MYAVWFQRPKDEIIGTFDVISQKYTGVRDECLLADIPTPGLAEQLASQTAEKFGVHTWVEKD